jgi:hypothetical protein
MYTFLDTVYEYLILSSKNVRSEWLELLVADVKSRSSFSNIILK